MKTRQFTIDIFSDRPELDFGFDELADPETLCANCDTPIDSSHIASPLCEECRKLDSGWMQ